MYFNANSQWWISLILIGVGFLCGFLYNFAHAIVFVFKNNVWVKNILELVATVFCGVLFLIVVNIVYYGEVRMYMIVAFVLGLYLELVTVGKIIAKTFLLLYNTITMWCKKLSKTTLVKRITK